MVMWALAAVMKIRKAIKLGSTYVTLESYWDWYAHYIVAS